jgi:hypothetical protein
MEVIGSTTNDPIVSGVSRGFTWLAMSNAEGEH